MFRNLNLSKREIYLLYFLLILSILFIYIKTFRTKLIRDNLELKHRIEIAHSKHKELELYRNSLEETENIEFLNEIYTKENFAEIKKYLIPFDDNEDLVLSDYKIEAIEQLESEIYPHYYSCNMYISFNSEQKDLFSFIKATYLNNDKYIINDINRINAKDFNCNIMLKSYCLEELPKYTKVSENYSVDKIETTNDKTLLDSIYSADEKTEQTKAETNTKNTSHSSSGSAKLKSNVIKNNRERDILKRIEIANDKRNLRIAKVLDDLNMNGDYFQIIDYDYLNKNLDSILENNSLKLETESNGEYIILKSSVNQLNSQILSLEATPITIESIIDNYLIRIISNLKEREINLQYMDSKGIIRDQSLGILAGENEIENLIFSLSVPREDYPIKLLKFTSEDGSNGNISIVDFIGVNNYD